MTGMFWPLTAAIYWPQASAVGAALSGVGGVVVYTICFSVSVTTEMGHYSGGWELHDVDCTLYAMGCGLFLLIFGSLMPKPWQVILKYREL